MSSFTVSYMVGEDGVSYHPSQSIQKATGKVADVVGTVYHPNFGPCFVVLPYGAHDVDTIPVLCCVVKKL